MKAPEQPDPLEFVTETTGQDGKEAFQGSDAEALALALEWYGYFRLKAHDGQLPPPGD